MTEAGHGLVIRHDRWRWYRLECGACGVLFPTAACREWVPDRCPACRDRERAESPPTQVRCGRPGCGLLAVARGWCHRHDTGHCRIADPDQPAEPSWGYVAPRLLDPGWRDRANCLGCDPVLFFPERGESVVEAKAVCAGCTVRANCLAFALAVGEKHGIWGGLSERERRRLRRTRAGTEPA